MLKFHLAQRLHVHMLSRAPLRAGDVFQPGRSQATRMRETLGFETGLTIGKGPDDPGPSSNFLHQPFQRIVRPDFAPMAVGEAVIAESLRTVSNLVVLRRLLDAGWLSSDHFNTVGHKKTSG